MQSKLKSKIKLALVLLVAIAALYLGLNGLRVGKYIVHPFGDALSWGPGFAGGFAAEYAVADGGDAQAAAVVMRARLKSAGFGEAIVTQISDDRLRAEVADADGARELLDAIAATGRVEFRDPDGGVVLDGRDFKSASTQYSADYGGYVLAFELTGGGAGKFAEATTRLTGQAISVYLDDELLSAPTISEPILEGMGQVPLGSGLTAAQARAQALSLEMALAAGEMPFAVDVADVHAVSQLLGVGTARGLGLAAAAGFVLALLLLIVRYRISGAAAGLVLVIEALAALVLMCETPGARVTVWSVSALLLGMVAAVASLVAVLERFHAELRRGAAPQNACKAGFKAALAGIFDLHVAPALVAAGLMLVGTGPATGFARALLIALGTSLAATLIALRAVLRWVADIASNSEKLSRRDDKRGVPALGNARAALGALGAAAALALVLALAGAGISGPDLTGGTLVRYAIGETYELSQVPELTAGARLAKAEASEQPDGEDSPAVDTGDSLTDLEVLLPTADAEAVAAARASIEGAMPNAALVSEQPISAAADGRLIGNLALSAAAGVALAALYIAVRFGISAGISALFAALYAVLAASAAGAVLGLLFRLDSAYFAAQLAVAGASAIYSAVLFGRVRENRRRPGLAQNAPSDIAEVSVRELSGWTRGAALPSLLAALGMLLMNTSRMLSAALIVGIAAVAAVATPLSARLWAWLYPRIGKGAKKAA